MNSTYFPKAGDIKQDWFVVDAQDVVLGRLSTVVASVLRGKHKPTFTPHADGGDFVIVVNAAKIKMTGAKLEEKMYHRHSGYPGGLKSETAAKLMARKPEAIIQEAVRGMLPHSRLGRKQIKKLKVYGGAEHPHQAQMPKPLAIQNKKDDGKKDKA